ncbi:MAG TPA: transglutaminase-like domain-containing protein, partial [Thermomicrobiales bacterium]|nr:transglutaminase-like domain-containing protein [Thermomicrobiales bacterium]
MRPTSIQLPGSTPTTNGNNATRSPFFPEGISTFLLLLALVGCASMSVESGDWERIVIPVTFMGLSAAVFGSLLAKLRVLDSLAHFCSMLIGIFGSFGLVLTRADDLAPTLRGRVRPLLTVISDWYLGNGQVEGHEVYLVSILMGIIVWLVGYLAAWTLFRRGWLMASVMLPGFLVLINLLYAPHADRRFLAAYLVIAIPLAARFHLYRRQREWSRARVPSPASGGMKFLAIGAVLGILVTTAGWNAPPSLSQQAFQPLAQKMSSQISQLQDRIDTLTQPTGAGQGSASAGSYASFGDAFTVGGALNLSNQPEMLVQGSQAPYLAAQRYDVYNGRGWSSDVDSTFNQTTSDGKSYSPAMTFRSDQQVLLSGDVSEARSDSSVIVTPLTNRDSVLFTIDTYLAANVPTSVRMSWRTVQDQPYKLDAQALGDLPPDVRGIATLLLQAKLTGQDGGSGPLPVDSSSSSLITQEQANLEGRFLTVHWTAGTDGHVDTLYVSGQLPVYDDVETVNGMGSQTEGEHYQVTGSASDATPDQLNQAGEDYPDWVVSRYLQQSSTVTTRTMELANEIAPPGTTPYEKAEAIQNWLRTNIAYDETVSAPPPGD